MSVNTVIIVNAVLDLGALGALGLVCRSPFRAMVMGRDASAPAQLRDARATARPTASRSGQRGGAAAAAMNRSAR